MLALRLSLGPIFLFIMIGKTEMEGYKKEEDQTLNLVS